MTFCIISHTPHIMSGGKIYAYGPYIKEINLWIKYVDEVIIVAPFNSNDDISPILLPYEHSKIRINKIPAISLTSFFEVLKTIVNIPIIKLKIFSTMLKSDHIHLRCPGNIGLLGACLQVVFPKKKKTAKYAGNWDPNASQPLSYRFQKWLLSNTFLTRNMSVLVYGDWKNQSKNVQPFFTASYAKDKLRGIFQKEFTFPFKFLFVGSLSKGKNPLYAIKVVEQLIKNNIDCTIDFFGDGVEREKIEMYIANNNLKKKVHLHGNQSAKRVEKAYKESHALVLPSKSEGWPKVVAEAMFWGLIPMVTNISCVPWMLGYGERGLLLTLDIEQDSKLILNLISNPLQLKSFSINAQKWSQKYTLDYFETEIQKMLV